MGRGGGGSAAGLRLPRLSLICRVAALYRASKHDCDVCRLKPRCCPKEPAPEGTRSIHEGARDLARAIAQDRRLLRLTAAAE